MLLTILRWLRGSVRFSISGRYPERFINITSRNSIRLWEVQRREEDFSACMYRADYRRIRPLARGAGVRLRLSGKHGLPELLRRYRDRAGVLFGMCAFILAVFFMSLFIWSVDITGLETISETDMRALLRERGLYVGAFKPGLDDQRIARDIQIERREIGWMAINISGSYASVEIKEGTPAPTLKDTTTPCNIKAERDGQILRIEAHEGKTLLTEGSGVIEGQLVVSGVVPLELSGNLLVHADARVIARTTRQATFSMPAQTVVLRPDDETAERGSLMLFGLRLPYRFGAVHSPYEAVERRMASPAPLGVTLPVGVMTERVTALQNTETAVDEASAKELLTRESELYETFSLPDCTVEAREFSFRREEDAYTLHVTYTCIEDVACAEPIGTDENTR